MLHTTRRFQVHPVESLDDLAEKLTGHDWVSCQAFSFEGVIFANDSTSPDGAQEYAVIRDGEQIESITFSWCTRAEARQYITQLCSGEIGRPSTRVTNTFQTAAVHGTCPACA